MTDHDHPGTARQGGRGPGPTLSPGVGRRGFLKGVGALGAAGLAGVSAPALAGTQAVASRTSAARRARATAQATPIQHVIIDCQENRSFDHYYGFAPFAGASGIPPGYSQPDGNGGAGRAVRLSSPSPPRTRPSLRSVPSGMEAR